MPPVEMLPLDLKLKWTQDDWLAAADALILRGKTDARPVDFDRAADLFSATGFPRTAGAVRDEGTALAKELAKPAPEAAA